MLCWINKVRPTAVIWHLWFTAVFNKSYTVVRDYRADNVLLQQSDLLGSCETIHQIIHLGLFLQQAWPAGPSLGQN